MVGFGNTSGFSTQFGASPLREKLTGYENIYGEQLGQPALNNIKAPEIEAYQNALTDSPDFEPFLQQRQRLLDIGKKLTGAGININNPRNADEVRAAMIYNQELMKYEQLGRSLAEQRKGYDRAVSLAGQEGVVLDPNLQDYTPRGLQLGVQNIPTYQQMRLTMPDKGFGTQQGAEQYNLMREQVASDMLQAYNLTPEQAASNPQFAQELERRMTQVTQALGRGSFDPDEATKIAQRDRQLRIQQQRANQASSGSGTTPPEPLDLLSEWQADLRSSNPADVRKALNYAGFERFPITIGDKQVKPTVAFPLVFSSGQGNKAGQTTGNVIYTTDPTLENRMKRKEVIFKDGELKELIGDNYETLRMDKTPYRIVNISQNEQLLIGGAAEQKTGYKGQINRPYRGGLNQATTPLSNLTPNTTKPKIDY